MSCIEACVCRKLMTRKDVMAARVEAVKIFADERNSALAS